MTYLWIMLLTILLLAGLTGGWLMTMIGLPGTWVMVIATAVYVAVRGDQTPISWYVVATIVGLAVIGEVVEFFAGAVGVNRAGGSRRSAVLALVGSVSGGLLGLTIGLPIPVVGSVIAALLCTCLGALTGAVLGEQWKGRTFDDSLTVGRAAFWSRLAGTFAKVIVASIILVVVLGSWAW